MKTHLASAVVLAGCASLAPSFSGCGSSADAPAADNAAATQSDLVIHIDPVFRYLTLFRDTRACPAPACGGYFVQEVNVHDFPIYVSSIDFSGSGLDDAAIGAVEQAPNGTVVVHGWIDPGRGADPTATLHALTVWRGMPHVTITSGDSFYVIEASKAPIVCIRSPCADHVAQMVNTTLTRSFAAISVAHAALPHVDQEWLTDRVLDNGALVAGHLDDEGTEVESAKTGRQPELYVSQVYLRLPDTPGPCSLVRHVCVPPAQPTFTRDPENRCLDFDTCAVLGCQITPTPTCPDGYRAVSWPADTPACMDFACDPVFIGE